MRYRVAKHKRGFVCVIYHDDGRRQRVALKAQDRFAATTEAAVVVGILKPIERRRTVGEVVDAYFAQSEAIWVSVERHHWKAASPTFAHLPVECVNERVCREYAGASKSKPGTIRKHLSIIRAALRWGARKNICPPVADFWLPTAPPPRDRRLSREEFDRLESAAHRTIHLYLFVRLARFTGARAGAIQGLVWECVDFDRRLISFGGRGRQKGRAVVPMHPDLAWQLVLAKGAAETNYVIEWAGKPVKSIKNAFRRAVAGAGLGKEVTPHVLRHTAASWMAEAGVPMSEIAAVLGHSDSRTTERVYARFSPTYLQRAVRALG